MNEPGLSCSDRNISFFSVEILLSEGLKENKVIWDMICQDSYIQIIQHLKLIQKNPLYSEKEFLISNFVDSILFILTDLGVKFFTKILDYEGGIYVNKLKSAGVTSFILQLIEQHFEYYYSILS